MVGSDRKFAVMAIAFAMWKWQESRGKGKLEAKEARRVMRNEGSECRLSRVDVGKTEENRGGR